MRTGAIHAGGVAVVTGAGSGIGRALASQLSGRGMKVAVVDRDADAASATVELLPDPVAAMSLAVDVTDRSAMVDAASRVSEAWGPASVLCNNAGVLRGGTAWTTSAEDWELSLGVNVMGVVNGLAAFLPSMIADARPAHVVTIASIGGLVAAPGVASYVASKHAVIGLSDNLRMELEAAGHEHVSVSVVCPGGVSTGIWAAANRAPAPPDSLSRSVLGAMSEPRPEQASPEQVADLVVRAVDERRFWTVAAQPTLHERVAERHRGVASALIQGSEGLYT